MEYDPNTYDDSEGQPHSISRSFVCGPNGFALRKADARSYSDQDAQKYSAHDQRSYYNRSRPAMLRCRKSALGKLSRRSLLLVQVDRHGLFPLLPPTPGTRAL